VLEVILALPASALSASFFASLRNALMKAF
jgi:hypothetical protein